MNWTRATLALLLTASMPCFASFSTETYPACDGSFCFGFNWKTVTVEELEGFDPKIRPKGGLPPLYMAARYSDDPRVIKKLVAGGGFAIAVETPAGQGFLVGSYEELDASPDLSIIATPLLFAAKYNDNPEIIDALVRAGDKVLPSPEGPSPLFHAARDNPNPEVAARLIKAGADINGAGFENAAWPDSARPISNAIDSNNLDMVAFLLQAGAKVNLPPTVWGGFAIHNVATVESIELLLDAGAYVNTRTHYEETPLHVVVGASNKEQITTAVVMKLLEAGADITAKNHRGLTPFDVACEKGVDKAITALLAANEEQENRDCQIPDKE